MGLIHLALDTCAYSAFKRGHPKVVQSLREADRIYLNPIVLGELRASFLKGAQVEKNQASLEAFLASPRVLVLGIDRETSERYALILRELQRQGRPIPTNDIWIAAVAMQHGLRLLTTDVHFLEVSQIVVDHHPL